MPPPPPPLLLLLAPALAAARAAFGIGAYYPPGMDAQLAWTGDLAGAGGFVTVLVPAGNASAFAPCSGLEDGKRIDGDGDG
mgnify:CR=1 FL=1